MTENLPSVAVVLFVKDEFSDIAGWIAWHAALGVEAFFVFDDHSSDGTWEILQAASKCYDIRLFRTDPLSEPDFYLRQRDSFMKAAALSRNEFDWIGFLDGDEYVYLRHFDSLPEFLWRFEDADGIAFSWRIHGSANRVVRPRITTIEAFPMHSTEALGDNVLVKSFVRPEKMSETYINPHWFDVPTERYARPSGRLVESANAVQEIEWSHGFVLHFICRSMEHYIQRIKRRLNADLSDSVGYWDHFDRNDETDAGPLRLVPRMEQFLAPIYEEAVGSAIRRLQSGQYGFEPAGRRETTLSPRTASVSWVALRSYFDTCLYCLPGSATIVHADGETAQREGLLPVIGYISDDTPDLIVLSIPGCNRSFMKFEGDARLMERAIFRLVTDENGAVALRNPVESFYMAFQPPENGIGKIEVNRHQAREWEQIALEPTELMDAGPQRSLPFAPGHGVSARDILHWLREEAPCPPSNDVFLRALYAAQPSVRAEISRMVPGLLWNALA